MDLKEHFSKKETNELYEILKNYKDYTEEAIDLVKNELKSRGCIIENESHEENFVFNSTDNSMNEENNQKVWWYSNNGERNGPISTDEVKCLIKTNVINKDTLIWRKELSSWLPISKSMFSDFFTSPPPIPVQNLNNKYAWNLALIPLYFFILDMFGLYNFFLSNDIALFYYLIAILINISVWNTDKKQLKKSGYDIETWMWWGIFLVPVYLFIRASKLDKNYAYAIVNLVLCLLPYCYNLLLNY
ncbi:MAG TPA: hypothetical protein DCE11_02690 [Ruminiclostridium sp.]|nr:hypothetical protein [Ruminiclostridium sp.]